MKGQPPGALRADHAAVVVHDSRLLERPYEKDAIVAGDDDTVRLAESLLRENAARIADTGPEVDIDGVAY